MRYVTGVLRPVERVHPTIPALTRTPDVTPLAIHHTRLLDDGTEVTLLEVRGDLERLHEVLASHSPLLEHEIAGDREGIVYCHSNPHTRARNLLRVKDRSELVPQMPLRFTGDGGLRVTLIGDDREFQEAVDNLPEELDFEIESIGDYRPDSGRLFSALTDRQQEVLRVAIREGYYENPREVSQQEVAEILGVTPGTASQTLRRIEANVFSEFLIHEVDRDEGR